MTVESVGYEGDFIVIKVGVPGTTHSQSAFAENIFDLVNVDGSHSWVYQGWNADGSLDLVLDISDPSQYLELKLIGSSDMLVAYDGQEIFPQSLGFVDLGSA